MPAWIDAPATREAIAAARELAPDPVSVGAYVTVLPPADPDTIDEHVGALIAAGADELHLYHLGLVNRERLAVLGRLASLERSAWNRNAPLTAVASPSDVAVRPHLPTGRWQ